MWECNSLPSAVKHDSVNLATMMWEWNFFRKKHDSINLATMMRTFKRKQVHFLSELIQKKKRLTRSKGLINRYATVGLVKVVFSDEKLFTIEEALNRQINRILSRSIHSIPEEHRLVKRVQKSISVMLWVGISATVRTSLIFIHPGAKINAATYKELVWEPVVKDFGKTM